MLFKLLLTGALATAGVWAQTNCVSFPAGLIPLSSIAYVTAANSAGDHLVVGTLANGLNTLTTIPLPTVTNQLFCDTQVQLTSQQFFPSVYVPTQAERGGNFSAFAGLLVDPNTNQPFSGGIIPATRLGAVYAFRIGPVQGTDTTRNWSPSGSMAVARFSHSAVLLPSGKVFVVGGSGGRVAEIYDPATGVFKSAGQTKLDHGFSLGVVLLNDGRVLIEGGYNTPNGAEIYDPVSGQFTVTGTLNQTHADFQSATTLKDGRVLVVGGLASVQRADNSTNAGAELYDPKTGTFSVVGPMTVNRRAHTATLLPDGRVLIAGGEAGVIDSGNISFDSAEIFDPATNQFRATASSMTVSRNRFFAALLGTGKVLLSGGFVPGGSTDLFDPATGRFTPTGGQLVTRATAAVALLSSGELLVGGGTVGNSSTPATELYNPVTGLFTSTGSMVYAREASQTLTLLDGRVLSIGGFTGPCCTPLASTEIYTPVLAGLVASQTGLTFRAAQGAGALASQTLAVLSQTDTIPFNVSVKTFTGGSWLKAAPASGTSGPGSPVTLTVSVDATGLTATDYYGQVTLTPTDGKHPPISVAIVLTIVPAGTAAPPGVTPAGLVFLGPAGASPKSQSFTIANVTSKALTLATSFSAPASFFGYTPTSTTISPGQSATITVTPNAASLVAGVYRGSIKLNFGDGSSQTVDILLVLTATPGSASERGAGGCVPSKLLPVLNSIGAGFTVPVAWPTPVIAQVVDDCGNPINRGAVTASFTNGDSPLTLVNIGGGLWSATWVPVRSAASTVVRADAQSPSPPLAGTVQVSGASASNPKVPVVAPGGVLSAGDYIGGPAQGLLVAIFGSAMADGTLGNSGAPLPKQLGSTSVTMSGVSLPIVFVSDGQVNALVPYELAASAPHQLIVQRGTAISVPVPITILENQPGILATAGNGKGQGHVYKITSSQAQILADAKSPAKAGDVLVIYTVGLGPVSPPLKSGDPAPFDKLENVTGTASLTIGGVAAQLVFAGLTPGFSGLYQINAMMPAGVTPGSLVPVVIAVNGRASAGAVTMAVQ